MAEKFLERPGEKVSELIQRQLPGFVRQDHPKLVAFLEAYYEWLDKREQPIGGTKRLLLDQDIDTTLDEFVTYFKTEFLPRIPEKALADKRKILKNIKQFYRARGTEKSFKFLFRIMFDSDVDFYYPGRDMLRASDGKWIKDTTIKIVPEPGTNPYEFEGRTIRGLTSGAFCVVETVRGRLIADGVFVYELLLNRESLRGVFEPGEEIADFDLNIQGPRLATVQYLFTGIEITNPGDGYFIGDPITITAVDGQGWEAQAKVLAIDPTDFTNPENPSGRVTRVLVEDYGAGYSVAPTVTFPPPVDPFDDLPSNTAEGTAIVGGMTDYPGFFLNADGKLSDAKYLQDSFFYQKFSYVLIVSESIDFYRDIVKELLHPAGLILFGQFQHTDELDLTVDVPLRDDGSNSCSQLTVNIMTELDLSLQGFMTFIDLKQISGVNRQGATFQIDSNIQFMNPDIIYSMDPETAKCLANFAKPGKIIYITDNSGNDGCYEIVETIYDDVGGIISIEVDSYKSFMLEITMAGGGTGDFVPGERVYQGGTHRLMPDACGYVESWDSVNGILLVKIPGGTFDTLDPVIGDTSAASHTPSTINDTTAFDNGRIGFSDYGSQLPLGLSLNNLEKNKFGYLPTEEDGNPATHPYPLQTFDIGAGSGTFELGEVVYQGATFGTATFTGEVVYWLTDRTTPGPQIIVKPLSGAANGVDNIKADGSGADYAVTAVNDEGVPGADSTEMVGVNAGYWDTYANTQIEHIENIIIGDIEDKPATPINIAAAPVLKSTY